MLEKPLQQKLLKINSYIHFALPAIIVIYLTRAFRYLKSPFYSPDAENYYLPYAKKFLSMGLPFIFQKDSLKLSIGTYVWPAILGAESSIIRYTNLSLGVLMIILIYDTGRQLHSKTAGIISSFLFAMSPIIIFWIPSLLSESPFIFFSLLFIWSMIKSAKGSKGCLLLSAFALTSSIFIRPVWLYPSLLFFPVFVMLFIFIKNQERRKVLARSIIILTLGLLLPLSFIMRNQIQYRAPILATSSGTALFYGTNPFTGGYEPPIINLHYGVGFYKSSKIESLDFIDSDKNLTSVAKSHLTQMNLMDFFHWALKKFSWFNFLTPLEASPKVSFIRILEFSLSLLGFLWAMREKKHLLTILGCAYILQAGQTIPALYNIRYSAGNLEPLLILLTPIGLAALLDSYKKNLTTFLAYSFLACAIFATGAYAHYALLPKILFPQDMAYHVLYETSPLSPLVDGKVTFDLPKISPYYPPNTFLRLDFVGTNDAIKGCKDSSAKVGAQKIGFDFNNHQGNTVYIGALTSADTLIPEDKTTLIIQSNCLKPDGVKITKASYIEADVEKYWDERFRE